MKRLRSLPDEFTLQQWLRRPLKLARKVLVCGCWNGHQSWQQSRGFRCRGRGSCGRYFCACMGGSEGPSTDNLCAECANKLLQKP